MRIRTAVVGIAGGGLVAAAAMAGASAALAWPGPYVTVAPDGSADYASIQAAVDAVPAGNSSTFTIKIKPGVYQGQVIIPADKPFVTFRGQGADPTQVVITDNRSNGTPKPDGSGTWGTSGSASVTISGHDFSARNLTFANSFDENAHQGQPGPQAVAVLTRADRLVFDNVRFLGNQDTLYINSPAADVVSRVYIRQSYIEGDVDFIFGRGTAVLDRSTIHSLNRGSTTNNGYVTAASTSTANPHGFLFITCSFTSDAPAETVFLGRPWHPSNDPTAIAQVTIRDSKLGVHLKTAAPWTDFGTWSWRDARYNEYHNRGRGAVASVDRPLLTAAQASAATPEAYLAGSDGWNPTR
jgi:pectinesterase